MAINMSWYTCISQESHKVRSTSNRGVESNMRVGLTRKVVLSTLVSRTHFGFTKIDSEMHIFNVITILISRFRFRSMYENKVGNTDKPNSLSSTWLSLFVTRQHRKTFQTFRSKIPTLKVWGLHFQLFIFNWDFEKLSHRYITFFSKSCRLDLRDIF